MNLDITHDGERSRFRVAMPEGEAFASYEMADPETIDLTSTWVPPAHRGRGVGERLVLAALEFAAEHGYRVIPSCPFVPEVLRRHPAYQELVADR